MDLVVAAVGLVPFADGESGDDGIVADRNAPVTLQLGESGRPRLDFVQGENTLRRRRERFVLQRPLLDGYRSMGAFNGPATAKFHLRQGDSEMRFNDSVFQMVLFQENMYINNYNYNKHIQFYCININIYNK